MVNCSFPRLVRAGAVLLVVGTITTQPTAALSQTMTVLERFMYWTECSPLRLSVVIGMDDHEDEVRIGLTEEVVTKAVRSRMRAARLYTDTSNPEIPGLVIHVNVMNSQRRTGGAFSIDVALQKHLYDPLSGHSFPAQTNYSLHNVYGLHAGNAAFILSGIARVMDGFLDDYLRVNESACY